MSAPIVTSHDLDGVPRRAFTVSDYAAAGVPELWVVDLNGRETHVLTDPAPQGYRKLVRTPFDAPISVALSGGAEITIAAFLEAEAGG